MGVLILMPFLKGKTLALNLTLILQFHTIVAVSTPVSKLFLFGITLIQMTFLDIHSYFKPKSRLTAFRSRLNRPASKSFSTVRTMEINLYLSNSGSETV